MKIPAIGESGESGYRATLCLEPLLLTLVVVATVDAS